MARPKVICQVCGIEEDAEVVHELSFLPEEAWTIHRIEQKGGFVQVLTCPACSDATLNLIFETYKDRIRKGLIGGYH